MLTDTEHKHAVDKPEIAISQLRKQMEPSLKWRIPKQPYMCSVSGDTVAYTIQMDWALGLFAFGTISIDFLFGWSPYLLSASADHDKPVHIQWVLHVLERCPVACLNAVRILPSSHVYDSHAAR